MRRYQTPQQEWSDGIHFVRAAGTKDRHPMRFVVGAHKATRSEFSRHVPSLEEGLARAREATKRWLKANPADREHWTEATPQAASGEDGRRHAEAAPPIVLQPFNFTYFNCIAANPVAQVWQCVARMGDRKTAGRRKANGQPAQPRVIVKHDIGECAVLLHDQPVREPDGTVKIYPLWTMADEDALDAYHLADEEDRLFWEEGNKCVHSSLNFDVIFDPDINGSYSPFCLWFRKYGRHVYVDRTKPQPGVNPGRRINTQQSPQALLLEREHRKRQQSLDRRPALLSIPLTFRTIHGAIEEAERRERMLKGEDV